MTYRDVLNRLRSSFYPQDMETTEYVGKIEQACEKQIEKKPSEITYDEDGSIQYWNCPLCGIQHESINYHLSSCCDVCGQAIDWQ